MLSRIAAASICFSICFDRPACSALKIPFFQATLGARFGQRLAASWVAFSAAIAKDGDCLMYDRIFDPPHRPSKVDC